MLAYIDRFKHFMRNWEKYSKDLLENFLKVTFKLVTLLDYEGVGSVFPFLSVITVKALIFLLPAVNGMIQTHLTQIWQMSCLKVLGDNSFLMKKYFKQEIGDSNVEFGKITLDDFLKEPEQTPEQLGDTSTERTKELDK